MWPLILYLYGFFILLTQVLTQQQNILITEVYTKTKYFDVKHCN